MRTASHEITVADQVIHEAFRAAYVAKLEKFGINPELSSRQAELDRAQPPAA